MGGGFFFADPPIQVRYRYVNLQMTKYCSNQISLLKYTLVITKHRTKIYKVYIHVHTLFFLLQLMGNKEVDMEGLTLESLHNYLWKCFLPPHVPVHDQERHQLTLMLVCTEHLNLLYDIACDQIPGIFIFMMFM